jgi:hypothetical protein
MKNLKPGKKLIVRSLLLFLLLVFVYLGYAYGKKEFPFGPEKWQVVQLSTGDFYYGKLQTFPIWELKEVYILQQIQQATSTQTQLVPLNEILYEPENTMKLNKDRVLWWANLEKEGRVSKLLDSR